MIALGSKPDPAPLSRTLLRLRHDFIMLGRAAATPLPEPLAGRLAPFLLHAGAQASDFLRRSATALQDGGGPPPLQDYEASLARYESEVDALRGEGLTIDLPSSKIEPLFTLGFALEQLHSNFADLARCVREYAQATRGKVA